MALNSLFDENRMLSGGEVSAERLKPSTNEIIQRGQRNVINKMKMLSSLQLGIELPEKVNCEWVFFAWKISSSNNTTLNCTIIKWNYRSHFAGKNFSLFLFILIYSFIPQKGDRNKT